MNKIDIKTSYCKCGKTTHRPGARFCINCGGKLPLQEKEAPESLISRIISEKTCPLSPTEKIVGANLINLPFFVTSSGYYWHFDMDLNIQESELPRLLIPDADHGEIIGIVAQEDMDPWALICWNYLIVMFNAFTTEIIPVWRKTKGHQESCFRLPCVLAHDPEQGKPGNVFRIFMIIKKQNLFMIRVSDFSLQVEQQKKWDYRVNHISDWPKLSEQKVLMMSAPVNNSERNKALVYLANIATKGQQMLLLKYNNEAEGYEKIDQKNVIRYNIKGMPNKTFKTVSQSAHAQFYTQPDLFVWVQTQDEVGNNFFEIYELREMDQKQPAYVMISWGTFEWHLGATSPLAVIQNDAYEKFLAFLDDDDIMQIINDNGKPLKYPLTPAPLDRLTPFLSCNDTIWAVEKEFRYVKKFWINEMMANDHAVDTASSGLEIGNICSELVLSNGNIYYLRKDSHANDQHATITMECIK